MSQVIMIKDNSELRILLDLADDPRRDVATDSSYTGLAVVVPDVLHERYLKYLSLDSSSPEVQGKKEKKKP